jgi:hypothetical protein
MHSSRFFRIGGKMKAINSFSFNRQSISIAICLSLAVPLMAVAATLQSRTLEAWNVYLRLAEMRIEKELKSSSGFVDFMKPIDAAKVLDGLKNGKIYVEPVRILDLCSRHQSGAVAMDSGLRSSQQVFQRGRTRS